MTTLQDYVSYESGAILYEDGTIWIGNWCSINGIPREFAGAWIGLNDLCGGEGELLPYQEIKPPAEVVAAMLEHELEQDPDTELSPPETFHAITIDDLNVTVIWCSNWA